MDDRFNLRAFDKTIKKMFYPNLFIDQHDVFLMLSTGIRDKNNKLIFEGDILNVFNWGYRSKGQLLGTTNVIWSETDKGFRYSDFDLVDDEYDQFRSVEIIGNIHENPELLER